MLRVYNLLHTRMEVNRPSVVQVRCGSLKWTRGERAVFTSTCYLPQIEVYVDIQKLFCPAP